MQTPEKHIVYPVESQEHDVVHQIPTCPEPEVAGHSHEVEQQEGHHQEEEHVETMNKDDTLSQFNDAVSEPVPYVPSARPKRLKQQNRKYDPEVYDLSTVGCRTKSRRSVRRAL